MTHPTLVDENRCNDKTTAWTTKTEKQKEKRNSASERRKKHKIIKDGDDEEGKKKKKGKNRRQRKTKIRDKRQKKKKKKITQGWSKTGVSSSVGWSASYHVREVLVQTRLPHIAVVKRYKAF